MPLLSYKEPILSPIQLRKLSEHKYSCTSASLLDPWLQPWWNWLVSKTPLWIAPNLITIIGLLINIVTTVILIMYSPDGRGAPPRWTCLLCALGLFIYQSLDSIDGKQARRTNTTSPLGELFDHGCDAISTVFVALSACVSCQLGHYPNWMFFQCFTAISLFYCAHWQTYVSGTLRFGKIDVTEAQFTIMALHIISAIFGPDIWHEKIFGNLELWSTLSLMTIICGIWSLSFVSSVILAGGVGKNGSTVALPIVRASWSYIVLFGITIGYVMNILNFSKIFIEGGSGKNGSSVAIGNTGLEVRTIPLYFASAIDILLAIRNAKIVTTQGCGKNGSTIAGTSVLSPIIPLTVVVLPAFIIAQKSPEDIFINNASLYILAFGMIAAKVTNKLVIAHMTKAEMSYMDSSQLGPALLFLNQYFNCPLPEIWLLWFTLIWSTQDLIRYCSQVCMEICKHLHINLFKIPYPAKLQSTGSSSYAMHAETQGMDKNGASANRKANRSSTKKLLQ